MREGLKCLTFCSNFNRKSWAPGGNQTHDLWITRCELYPCATTTAGSLKIRKNSVGGFFCWLALLQLKFEFEFEVHFNIFARQPTLTQGWLRRPASANWRETPDWNNWTVRSLLPSDASKIINHSSWDLIQMIDLKTKMIARSWPWTYKVKIIWLPRVQLDANGNCGT